MPQATKEKLTSKERLTEKPPVTEHVRELTYGENAPGQAGFSPDPEDFSLENPESETGTINSRW